MMDLAATLTDVAQALTSLGLNVYSQIPDANDFPALVLLPPKQIRYVTALAGRAEIDVTITLYVSNADLGTALGLLYQLLSYRTPLHDTLVDTLYTHTSNNYKSLLVTSADNFREEGSAIAVDINLTINV